MRARLNDSLSRIEANLSDYLQRAQSDIEKKQAYEHAEMEREKVQFANAVEMADKTRA